MSFIQAIEHNAEKNGSLLCLELNPSMGKTALFQKSMEFVLTKFFSSVLDACATEKILPNAVKPNYAFFAQYGFEGLRAMHNVIEYAHALHIPVILDAKSIHVKKSAGENASEVFGFWKADATTVNPFLESEPMQPLLDWCEKHQKGLFVSTPASHAQLLYEKLLGWNRRANGNVGTMVQAAELRPLQEFSAFFSDKQSSVPVFFSSLDEQLPKALGVLKKSGFPLAKVLVNSPSGMIYSYGNNTGLPNEEASVKAIRGLHKAARV